MDTGGYMRDSSVGIRGSGGIRAWVQFPARAGDLSIIHNVQTDSGAYFL
jgi:hypothetical protein